MTKPETKPENWGPLIKEWRVRAQMSQTALAKKMGVDQAMIARLEAGQHQPKLSTLERWAAACGLGGIKVTPATL